MANLLTILRILCALLILICPAFSPCYYLFFITGGLSDALDGTLARRRGEASELGARLDTIADFAFLAAVMIKLAFYVHVPSWLIVCVIVIAAIKLSGIIVGAAKYRRLVTVHSVLNKLCGALVFTALFFAGFELPPLLRLCAILIVVSTAFAAAIHEFFVICSGKAQI